MKYNDEDHYETNAVITGTRIGFDRGVFLCVWLDLDYGGGTCQGFGGYVLGGANDSKCSNHRDQKNICGEFIARCLEMADVEQWDKMVGKTIRVRKTDSWGDIIEIGHIVKDKWFNPKETFEDWKKDEK